MFIFLQEAQISFDLYAAVICVALKQNKHASELTLLGKNIPKDHEGIFPPHLPGRAAAPRQKEKGQIFAEGGRLNVCQDPQ